MPQDHVSHSWAFLWTIYRIAFLNRRKPILPNPNSGTESQFSCTFVCFYIKLSQTYLLFHFLFDQAHKAHQYFLTKEFNFSKIRNNSKQPANTGRTRQAKLYITLSLRSIVFLCKYYKREFVSSNPSFPCRLLFTCRLLFHWQLLPQVQQWWTFGRISHHHLHLLSAGGRTGSVGRRQVSKLLQQ